MPPDVTGPEIPLGRVNSARDQVWTSCGYFAANVSSRSAISIPLNVTCRVKPWPGSREMPPSIVTFLIALQLPFECRRNDLRNSSSSI